VGKSTETTTKFKVDISELKSELQEANRQIALTNAEFKEATAGMDDWKKSADGLDAKITQLTKDNQSYTTILAEMKTKYDEVVAAEGEDSAAAQDLQVRIKNLQASITGNEAAIAKYTNQAEKMRESQDSLTTKIKDQNEKLTELKSAYVDATTKYGKNSDEAKSLATQIHELSGEISDEEQTLQKATDAANSFDRSAENAGDSAKKAGDKASDSESNFAKLASTLATGVVAGAKAAVQAFEEYITVAAKTGTKLAETSLNTYAEYENSMSQVQATMGITKDATSELNGETVNTMDTLGALAKQMGSETAFSASECADALNYLALAGYNTQEITDTLPSVLDLAAAGSMDLADASDMVTDALSALGMETSDADTFVDELAKTSSVTNTSVSQLGEAILTVGGTAKSMAGGTEEMNTALGILANNGIKGAEGGTALRNVILSLQSPTDTASAALQNLGVSVYDSGGEMRSLNDILGDLNTSMDAMTDEEKNDIINTIFNKTDLKSVQALLASTGDTWDNFQESITNSADAAGQMADTQLDNLSGQLTILKSAAEGVTLTIGEQLAPATKDLVTGITDIANAFNTGGLDAAISQLDVFVGQLGTMITQQLPQVLPGIMQAFNDVATALVSGIATLLPPLIENILPILVNSFLDLIVSLADVLSANIAPISDAIFAALWDIFDLLPDKLAEMLPSLGNAIATIAGQIPYLLGDIFASYSDTLADIFPDLLPIITNAINAVVESLADELPLVLDSIVNSFPTIITAISDNLPTIVDAAIDLVDALIDGLIDSLPDIIDAAVKIVDAICNGLLNSLPAILDAAVKLILNLVNGLLENLPLLINAAVKIVTQLVSGLVQCIPQLISAALQLINGLIDGLIQNLPQLIVGAIQLVQGLVDGLLQNIPMLIDAAFQLISGLASGLIENIPMLIETIPEIVSALWDGVSSVDWLGLGASALESILNGILSLAETLITSWDNVFTQLWNDLKSWAASLWDVACEAAQNIWDGIVNKISGLGTEVKNWLDETVAKIVLFATDAKNAAEDAAKNIVDGIINNITGLAQSVYNIGSDIVTGLWNGIGDMAGWLWDKISGFCGGILDNIKDFFGIASPSKVMKEKIGQFLPMGMAKGVDDKADVAVDAMHGLGKRTLAAAKDAMADVQNELQIGNGVGNVGSQQIVNNYSFNQTNNSPKALSRYEIYRQSKNLLNAGVG
jgi:TP901 family phage tail tape measure protein